MLLLKRVSTTSMVEEPLSLGIAMIRFIEIHSLRSIVLNGTEAVLLASVVHSTYGSKSGGLADFELKG